MFLIEFRNKKGIELHIMHSHCDLRPYHARKKKTGEYTGINTSSVFERIILVKTKSI